MQSFSQLQPTRSIPINSLSVAVVKKPDDDSTHIQNLGMIAELALTGSWSKDRSSFSSQNEVRFAMDGEPLVKFQFFQGGYQLSQAGTDKLRAILSQPPHLLDGEESQSLSEALRDKIAGADFACCSIKTSFVAPRMVLMVEGVNKKANIRSVTMFVDSGTLRECSTVQELTFLAPRDAFYKCYGDAMNAFKSVAWSK